MSIAVWNRHPAQAGISSSQRLSDSTADIVFPSVMVSSVEASDIFTYKKINRNPKGLRLNKIPSKLRLIFDHLEGFQLFTRLHLEEINTRLEGCCIQ